MIEGQRIHTNLHLSFLIESNSVLLVFRMLDCVYLVVRNWKVSASFVCNNIWKGVMQANM